MASDPNNPTNYNTTDDVMITLYVDTVNITSGDASAPGLVFLADNHSDQETSNLSLFETNIQQNSQLSWSGAVLNIQANPNDYVLITDVRFTTDNININKRSKFNGRGPNGAGSGDTHIDAIPANINSTIGAETDYTIYFTVCHYDENNNPSYSQCTIDPKLKMNPN